MYGMHRQEAHRELLTEQQLKHMSRNVRELLPRSQKDELADNDIKTFGELFEDVFFASENPDISASHRIAAWNLLCALIDQSLTCGSDVLSNLVWHHRTWDRALGLYIEHGHNARPKSSKQLLATLCSAWRARLDRRQVDENVAKRLIEGILSQDASQSMRYCLQVLAKFLSTDILPLRDILSALKELKHRSAEDERATVQDLLYILLATVSKSDLGSVVSQVLSVVLDKAAVYPAQDENWPTDDLAQRIIWIQPLEVAIKSNVLSVDELKDHILPTLFKRDLSDYVQFLYRHGLQRLDKTSVAVSTETEQFIISSNELLYAALQTGKELGLLYETEDSQVSLTSSSMLIPVSFIASLLSDSESTARIAGLSLLITSYAATKPFPRSTLRLLRRHLHTFFADTDANFRSELFSLMQGLMDRLRAVTAVLARKSNIGLGFNRASNSSRSACLNKHRAFLEWLLRFLNWELRPTASYQRHISALNTLTIVSRSGIDTAVPSGFLSKSALTETKWPFQLSIMNPGLQRLLLDLLLDPFEDVRQTTAALLALYTPPYQGDKVAHKIEELSNTIGRAEALMLVTGRADQADGVAHLYALLYRMRLGTREESSTCSSSFVIVETLVKRLEHMLQIAKSNLSEAISRYPLHGLFTSLRYLVTQHDSHADLDGLMPRLITCIHEIWNVVKPVLCNDAPEGYLPEETENMSEVSTKDTLSYCWRGLKESSLLLKAIVSRRSIDSQVVVRLGNLCFTQLVELRHRGAFSTVAQSWVTCCLQSAPIHAEIRKSPLQGWYEQVLHVLVGGTTINTRRSAGIPHLICGLLISDQSGEFISQAFKDLSITACEPVASIGTGEPSLPQVHAINCIKEILKTARLREYSERYIAQSLHLASASLRSEAWAIRNCGLMLFRAVIDRLLGTSEAHLEDETSSPSRITTHQVPQLLNVTLDLLDQSRNLPTSPNEGVLPALQLLQRINIPEEHRSRAGEAVLFLMANKSWHIRDKAARTYAALVQRSDMELEIQRLLQVGLEDQNSLHGSLLALRYLIRKLSASATPSSTNDFEAFSRSGSAALTQQRNVFNAISRSSHLYHNNRCAVTKALYLDILIDISDQIRGRDGNSDQNYANKVFEDVKIRPGKELEQLLNAEYIDGGTAALRTALARAFGKELRIRTYASPEDHTVSLMVSLARKDPDACCSLFGAFFSHSTCQPAVANLKIVLLACRDILVGDFDLSLRCEIQKFLLGFTDIYPARLVSEEISEAFIKACTTPQSPWNMQSNQQYADQWLQLTAVALDLECGLRTGNAELTHIKSSIANWVEHWCSGIQENGLFSRDAAATAISRMTFLWRRPDRPISNTCRLLCLGVYDLLNDDDEQIRLLASQTASRIAGRGYELTSNDALEPIFASQELIKIMIDSWGGDVNFIEAAFLRAFDFRPTGCVSVSKRLAAFETTNNALFAEEKQNLYIDDAKEVKVWSQALFKCDAHSIPKASIVQMARWVSDSLDVLRDKATLEVDGALGWSTKPEVFTLGLQVIYCAEFLLHVVECDIRIPIRPSTITLKLGKFDEAVITGNLNVLWRTEIDRVLKSAVIRKLRLVTSGLSKWSGSRGVALNEAV